MTSFEEYKRDKLNRLKILRIMWLIGMVAWRENRYGEAEQKLRMVHPLSWAWLLVWVCFVVVMHGAIEVSQEIKRTLKDDMVLW